MAFPPEVGGPLRSSERDPTQEMVTLLPLAVFSRVAHVGHDYGRLIILSCSFEYPQYK